MSEPIEHDTPAREAKMLAEAQKAQAEAEYFRAKTHGQMVDNETATALSVSAGIAVKRETLKDQWDAASNGRNRAYHFTDNVSTDTVEAAVDVFNRWQRLDKDNVDPYRLIICSPGGSVVSGMKLYSTIKAIAAKRPVITVASGLCASMATIIHQAGSYRIIEPGCSYMIHDVSGEVFGSLTNMQDTMDWLAKLNSALHVCLAEKSHKTVEEIAEMSKRRDSWFMPEDVVEMGFADEIGFATE
jgi:ATP-dependent protease ClpP protease subunit